MSIELDLKNVFFLPVVPRHIIDQIKDYEHFKLYKGSLWISKELCRAFIKMASIKKVFSPPTTFNGNMANKTSMILTFK